MAISENSNGSAHNARHDLNHARVHHHHHKAHLEPEIALSRKEEAAKKKAARDKKINELNDQLEKYTAALQAIINSSGVSEPEEAVEPHLERARTACSWILITAGLANEAAYTFVNTMCQLALIMSVSVSNIPTALRWSIGSLTSLFSAGIEVEVYRGEMAEGMANFKMIAKEHLKEVSYDHKRAIKKDIESSVKQLKQDIKNAKTRIKDFKERIRTLSKQLDDGYSDGFDTSGEDGKLQTLNNKIKNQQEIIGRAQKAIRRTDLFTLVEEINDEHHCKHDHHDAAHDNHHHKHSEKESKLSKLKRYVTKSLNGDTSETNISRLLVIANELKHHQDDILDIIKGHLDDSFKGMVKCIDTINTLNGKLNLLKKAIKAGFQSKEEREEHRQTKIATTKQLQQMLKLLEWHWRNDKAFELYEKDRKTHSDRAHLTLALLESLDNEQQHDRMLNSLVKAMMNDAGDRTLKKKITTKKICTAVFGRFLLPLAAAPSIFFGFSNVFSQMLGSWSSTTIGTNFIYGVAAFAALAVMLYISNEFVKIIAQNKFKRLFLDYIDKFKELKKKKAWGKIFLHVFLPMVIVASIAVACSFGFSSYAGYAIGGVQTLLGGTLSATTTTLVNVSAGCYMGGDIGVFMSMSMIESFNKISLDDIKRFFTNVRDHLKSVFYTKIRENFKRVSRGKIAWLRCVGLALATVVDCVLAVSSVVMLPAFFIAHLISSSISMNANSQVAESTATTISASLNEAGADMCFMHGHTNIIEQVYRFFLYIGPVWVSTLVKSLVKAYKEDVPADSNDKTPRWCRLFDQAMRDEWKVVCTGKAPNKMQSFDEQAEQIAFPPSCDHAH